MSQANMGDEQDGPPSGEVDIPPAIACAHCGRPTCEGCAPIEDERVEPLRDLPWETEEGGLLRRLFSTAELTAKEPGVAFGKLKPGELGRALGFAVLCEVWAVGSFSVAWGSAFYLLFPFLARRMATSIPVLALAASILVALVVFVVLMHAFWGLGIEWGIARAGRKANWNLGLRFGFYACGWDLLTSPAGYLGTAARRGVGKGWQGVVAGARAPRPSLRAYLIDCRKLSKEERRTAVWTAVILGSVAGVVSGLALFALLFALWLV